MVRAVHLPPGRFTRQKLLLVTRILCQRLLATLVESKDFAPGLAKGCNAVSSKLSAMAVASHAAKNHGCMGNPSD
ncbi:hypothetical protein B296_00048998 [Ensete ventricosum]|uniref:Uncharacterized protein n=1 Tax=Ensete ventricosum TaxID=4639 RepID=A0A426WZ23_ENSVE|nr:hypothetical protein B296_00048998 [Ensete ventricosum]